MKICIHIQDRTLGILYLSSHQSLLTYFLWSEGGSLRLLQNHGQFPSRESFFHYSLLSSQASEANIRPSHFASEQGLRLVCVANWEPVCWDPNLDPVDGVYGSKRWFGMLTCHMCLTVHTYVSISGQWLVRLFIFKLTRFATLIFINVLWSARTWFLLRRRYFYTGLFSSLTLPTPESFFFSKGN